MAERRDDLIAARVAAGHTQESLAEAIDVYPKSIRNWEHGNSTPTRDNQLRLAPALNRTHQELRLMLGLTPPAIPVHSWQIGAPESSAAEGVVHAQIPYLRRALDTRDVPPDGQTRTLNELRSIVQSVVERRLQSDYATLSAELPEVLHELHRAILIAPGSTKRQYARLLAFTYRATDAIADKFGYYDLSARIIQSLREFSLQSEDSLLVGTSSYVRGEIFFASEDLQAGRRILEAAANDIRFGESETAAATYGTLHMRAAVMAARAGNALQARDHIEEAQQVARLVNEGIHLGTAFGAASVRIHRLSLAVEIGDAGEALRLAGGWRPPFAMPAERRSHFYIDLGRASHLADQPERALSAFQKAWKIAPEHVREHPQVFEIVEYLKPEARGELRDAVSDFAANLVKPQGQSSFGL
ncbi:helix-turn-helix domain-containing protein [Amycolatopsis sp. NPDC049868]|uniref:helix-turn-helix domain-containing protein n=1 Tax=Amycolatopsis sp. NPDC049868 TaxID=3363934 RepID=UPI0037A99B58